MKKRMLFILLISALVILTVLISNSTHPEKIMTVGYPENITSILYARAIYNEKVIAKFEKLLDNVVFDGNKISQRDDLPEIILRISEKNIERTLEIWDKTENAILSVNEYGRIKKGIIDSSKLKVILEEIENLEEVKNLKSAN